MIKQASFIGAIIVLIVAMAHVVLSDVPQLISFQGKLHDSAGNPLAGLYEITFRIYNVESGGTHIWTETSNVSCENGLYNVILGLINPMNLGFDGDYWLSVQVTEDDELSPRYRIVSVPVAIRAAIADSAHRVSWNSLTDVPEGFADGTDDVGAAGGVSQINDGTGIDVTNPTGPTTTVAHSADASALSNAHHTKTTSATELTSGKLDNACLNMGHGNGIDADKVDGKHASELADSDHQHDERYYTEAELNTNDGTVNQAGDPVSWNKIKDMPAGFADGTDDVGGVAGGGWVDDGTVVRLETGSDKVGIGTTGPNGQLHIRNTTKAVVNIGGNGNLDKAQLGLFEDSDTGEETGIRLEYDGSNNELNLVGYGVGIKEYDLLTIQRDGNVGIGTTSPGSRLDVKSSGSGDIVGVTSSDGDHLFRIRQASGGHSGVYVCDASGNDAVVIGGAGNTYFNNSGNVGIGTTSPGAKLDVNGDLLVTGAYRGNIGPHNGAPFPRPAYDSGWTSISQAQTITFNHNLGGNIDNYVVDVSFYDYETGPNHTYYGGYPGTYGAHWYGLTTQKIEVHRMTNDVRCDMVRVRIWVYN